jgi:hypothetical protein
VEVIEPETNCTVRIIGVFHGSYSSSKDVMQCVTSSTDAVVLELCSDRYRDLILKKSSSSNSKSMQGTSESSDIGLDPGNEELAISCADAETPPSEGYSVTSWFEQYVRVVSDTIRRQGWRTGIVVATFGLVNGFQQQILQLQPGLEFITASDISSNYSIPIILADQDVAITLQRIGQLPQVTYNLWYDFIRTRSWATTFGPLSYALSVAILGGWIYRKDGQKTKLLSLPQFLTRNLDAFKDLLRLVGFPLLVIQALNFLPVLTQQGSASTIHAAMSSLGVQQDDTAIATIINIIVIILFYLCVALPATQVILTERDDVLATGIRMACRLAYGKHKSTLISIPGDNYSAYRDAEVVVVLGLLHVNGVALRVSQNYENNFNMSII